MNKDISDELQQLVENAAATKKALSISAGNSKSFYGRKVTGEAVNLSGHSGIVNYEPTELVITARAGTPLKEIETVLAGEGQMFGFEPPGFGDTATIGGTIAGNFSGPARAYSGAARDFVLGSKIINGRAEILQFGGEVMKNVAGYDVSRLMCGALGTLGILLELSIKVLPRPETELTLVQETNINDAVQKLHGLARQSLPISASCISDNRLHIRLSGTQGAVQAARKIIGGDELAQGAVFWQELKEQQHAFFKSGRALWRISLASNAPQLDIPGEWLYEWGGAQRWLITDACAEVVREQVSRTGGHATCFRSAQEVDDIFHPLSDGLFKIQRQLKLAFDPELIFNPGRIYPGL